MTKQGREGRTSSVEGNAKDSIHGGSWREAELSVAPVGGRCVRVPQRLKGRSLGVIPMVDHEESPPTNFDELSYHLA